MKAYLAPADGSAPFEITVDPLLVGRADNCGLVLTHSSVSKTHCVITRDGKRLLVLDLQSKNGIRVNGVSVQRATLESGDMLEVAAVAFRVRLAPLESRIEIPVLAGSSAEPLPSSLAISPAPTPNSVPVSWQEGVELFPGCRLQSLIARGGTGEVWGAELVDVGPVAVKRLRMDKPIERESRSLRAMKGMRHRCLIRVLGYHQVSKDLAIVLERADQTLQERFEKAPSNGTGIAEPELLRYCRQIAEALDFLYFMRRVLHRDVKPSNILLVRDVAKLGDFGLAKVLERSLETHSGIASFDFAPPEFFEGRMAATSDQFSLAATYCYLRTGQKPFPGPDIRQMALQHAKGNPILEGIPPAQRSALQRALHRDAASRFPSCSHFIRSLRRAAALPDE